MAGWRGRDPRLAHCRTPRSSGRCGPRPDPKGRAAKPDRDRLAPRGTSQMRRHGPRSFWRRPRSARPEPETWAGAEVREAELVQELAHGALVRPEVGIP